MTKRNCTNTMVLWDSDTKDVVLTPWPYEMLGTKYDNYSTGLACCTSMRKATFEQRKTQLFVDFAHLVVGDGIDPIKLHNLFLELEEWRDGCAIDMPGAFKALERHGELDGRA